MPGHRQLRFLYLNKLPVADTSPKVDGENEQSTPPAIPSHDYVKVSFTGVSITGQGPVGVELVRSRNSDVTFERLNMDNEESCTTKADIVDGTMQITVGNHAPKGLTVNFSPIIKMLFLSIFLMRYIQSLRYRQKNGGSNAGL